MQSNANGNIDIDVSWQLDQTTEDTRTLHKKNYIFGKPLFKIIV